MPQNIIADMLARNESVPRGPAFGWSQAATTTMGLVPHAASLPGWYVGTPYVDWPVIIPWVAVFHDGGAPYPTNTRVALKNIVCAMWSVSQSCWVTVSASPIPQGGQEHDAAFSSLFTHTRRTEADGSESLKPTYGNVGEVWAHKATFDIDDLGGWYCAVDHRLVIDDSNGPDTTGADRWLVQMGADYYPDLVTDFGATPVPGVATGRILRATPAWRKSTMLLMGSATHLPSF